MQAERTTIELFKHSEKGVPFPAGTIIFRESAPATEMFVIKSGYVRLERKGVKVETLGPGDILGEMALLTREARSMTATAETDAELVPIDEDRFQFLVEQTPYFALDVMRILATRLQAMNTRVS